MSNTKPKRKLTYWELQDPELLNRLQRGRKLNKPTRERREAHYQKRGGDAYNITGGNTDETNRS